MDEAKEFILKYALKYGSFRFAHLDLESPIKVEVDSILANPDSTKLITLELLRFFGKEISSIGGVATGGIHWAARVASYMSIPEFCIQKDGTISGAISGNLVGIIEDVVTTGESLDNAINVVRKIGNGIVPKSLSIFSYGFREDIPAIVCFKDIREEINSYHRSEVNKWYDRTKEYLASR